jgi:sn-glycerol 3-phosphate transport system permease protein
MLARTKRDSGTAAIMLLPSLIVLGTFVLYPLVRVIMLGRQRCPSGRDSCFTTNWGQYVDAFRSYEFQHSLKITVLFALLTVPAGLVLGVGLAVLADKALRGMSFFRTVFSSTIATSVAVASLMWLFLLNPSVGVLTRTWRIAEWFPILSDPGLLQNRRTALVAVSLSSIWASLGFTFIVVTAGLQGVPRDLYESAYVDGAGGFRRFWEVTLPMLRPTLLFATVVLTTRAFQAYGEFDLLTDGGPILGPGKGATTTLTYLIYGQASTVGKDEGLQSSVAVLLFLILLVVSALQFRGFAGKKAADAR